VLEQLDTRNTARQGSGATGASGSIPRYVQYNDNGVLALMLILFGKSNQ
jgi:hypothetical protein